MVVRNNKRSGAVSNLNPVKRRKVEQPADEYDAAIKDRHLNKYSCRGSILTLGVGDTGQLGLGPDITERSKPAKFTAASLASAGLDEESSKSFVQVVAGGMHTVCLTEDGRVFTFGCNDEGALGRPSTDTPHSDDEAPESPIEESRPGVVRFPEDEVHIKMVSAGDSHSAALDTRGRVWLWGTFRGASGAIGLTKEGEICRSPIRLESLTDVVVKIVSGQDHLVCLTTEGRLLTMGCGEQGQLGRIAERFSKDGGRNGYSLLLQPGECRLRGNKRFVDVWAGGFATIARCLSTNVIYACGLNNYGQLALIKQESVDIKEKMEVDDEPPNSKEKERLSETMLAKTQGPLIQYMLTPANGFDSEKDWTQFAIGMHHTLALTASGDVYAVGRCDYGRLGFPISKSDSSASAVTVPHMVKGPLEGRKSCWIGCGEACSFAVDDTGKAFSWGMGSNQQLAHEEEDEDTHEPEEMIGKNLSNTRAIMVDAGGQHAVMLVASNVDSSKSEGETSRDIASPVEERPATENNLNTLPAPMDVDLKAESLTTNEKVSSDKPVNYPINPPPEVASTAGATVNSSSVHSCSLVEGDQSSLSSAHSTDGGGSSRLGGSVFAQPIDAPLNSKVGLVSATGTNCGGGSTSTSEPGFPPAEGSNTASPANTH